MEYIKEKKESLGIKFKEAQAMWMKSDERTALINTLPMGERKKRRFELIES